MREENKCKHKQIDDTCKLNSEHCQDLYALEYCPNYQEKE